MLTKEDLRYLVDDVFMIIDDDDDNEGSKIDRLEKLLTFVYKEGLKQGEINAEIDEDFDFTQRV